MNDKTAVQLAAVLTRFIQQEPADTPLDGIKSDLQAAFADAPNSDARLLREQLNAVLPVIREAGKRAFSQGFSHAEEIYAKQIAGHDAEVAKVQMDAAERNQMQEQIVGLQSENSQMEAKLRKLGELRKALNEFLG